MENKILGNIKILKKLGEGGMGAVWLGHHQTLDKKVAVKVLPQELARDETFAARFIREARAAARLEHPNVIQVLDADTHDGVRYIVMQYVEGTDVQKAIKRKGALPLRDCLSIVKRVAAALQAAHELGLIHRDVKPSNIMVTAKGGVFIGDFGLARDTASGRTVTGAEQVVGTPHYMSPEQARGERLDARSDIYSLGATLYAMLTARPPFEAETPVGVMVKHAREDQHPEPVDKVNPAVPAAVAAVVTKMMSKAPAGRYAAMKDVVAAIKQAQDGAGLSAAPAIADAPTVVATQVPARTKRPWLIPVAAGAAGMLIFLMVLGGLLGRGARKAFDEAARAETAAGADPDNLQAAAKLYEAVALAFPQSAEAPEARRKAEAIQRKADEARFAADLAKLAGMTFADALTSLQELRRLHPEAAVVKERLEALHRARLISRSEELSALMRDRADDKMLTMMDPRDVGRMGKAGAFVFRKTMTAVLTGNEFVVSATPSERKIDVDLVKESATVGYQLMIETEPGKRKPGGLVLPWVLHQGEWYVSLAALGDRLSPADRPKLPFRGKTAPNE